MNPIDFTPLYRSSIGFDRLVPMLDSAMNTAVDSYPPYDIEVLDDSHYVITLAVAGFERKELDIQVENNTLIVRGIKDKREDKEGEKNSFLHRGIANRSFERKFQLAEYVEVTEADLKNGILAIDLVKEIPEKMKPRSISISEPSEAIEHKKVA